jgi:hypothetical protein
MALRRAAALAVLAVLVWCPLASAGVFTACHEGEEAMDCCQPQEGSGAPTSPGTKAPVTVSPVLASAQLAAPAAATAIWIGPPGDSIQPRVPLHTLHSVFRI